MQGVFMKERMSNCYILLNGIGKTVTSPLNINVLQFNINNLSKKITSMLYNIEN